MCFNKIFLLLAILNPFIILSEEPSSSDTNTNIKPIANLNSEPSAIINNAVNAITGDYNISQTDLVIPGAEPLVFHRHYSSSSYTTGSLCKSWNINHYSRITTDEDKPWKDAKVYENGKVKTSFFPSKLFKGPSKKNTLQMALYEYSRGVTNCASGVIGGSTNIKNARLVAKNKSGCTLIAGNGDRSFFKSYKKQNDTTTNLFYTIDYINKVTGNQIVYKYNKDNKVRKVKSTGTDGTTLAKASYKYYEYKDKHRDSAMQITASDGRSVKYTFFNAKKSRSKEHRKLLLTKVKRSDAPIEHYEYCKRDKNHQVRLIKKYNPDNRFQQVKYYKNGTNNVLNKKIKLKYDTDIRINRVRALVAPIGTDDTPITTHQFIYHEDKKKPGKYSGGRTEVYDAHGNRTDYKYNSNLRLTEVRKFAGGGNHNLYTIEKMIWGKDDHLSHLMKRTFEDAQGNLIFTRQFDYDARGNILQDILTGDLTGNQNNRDEYIKCFTYSDDERNLMTSFDDGSKKVIYDFEPGTNLLSRELTYEGSTIRLRKFYHYNIHGVVEREIIDDGNTSDENNLSGVSQRLIKQMEITTGQPTGLPITEQHKYLNLKTGKEETSKTIFYTYTLTGKVTSRKIHDCNNILVSTETFEYDAHGNLTKITNPLGETTRNSYDANDNLIKQVGPDSSFHKVFEYDYSNRLIAEKIVRAGKDNIVTSFRYDLLGNKIASIDQYGNETTYCYDSFGRLICTTLPSATDFEGATITPSIEADYDCMSFQTKKVDANGNTEITAFTLRGTPYLKTFADGTQERYQYHPNGTLKTRVSPTGMTTHYTHDYQNRVIKEETYSASGKFLASVSREYNAFHLLQETDAEGITTAYTYYPDGKMHSNSRGATLTVFEYDTLGRKHKTKKYYGHSEDDCTVEVVEYDALNRIMEERTEDGDGVVHRKKSCEYDSLGNKVHELVWTEHGVAVSSTEYDFLKRIVKATDSEGHATHTIYNDNYCNALGQKVLLMEITAPDGTKAVKEHDALGRIVKVDYRDRFGTTLRTEETTYDAYGNKVHYSQGDADKQVISVWEYDSMNRLVAQVEAFGTREQKTVTTHYNQYGQKETVVKPNGTELHHTYDEKGRLLCFSSSDQTFAYQYTYDQNDTPIEVCDLIHETSTKKVYDDTGRLIHETLGNGLELAYQYDRQGRPLTVTLPDRSSVAYTYDAAQLVAVTRRCKNGRLAYQHQYTKFDLSGHPLKIKLPGEAGELASSFDLLGRLVRCTGDSWEEILSYDNVGNLVERTLSIHGCQDTRNYQYDPLRRLTNEPAHSYQYDALHNRVAKNDDDYDLNCLNQVTFDGTNRYYFDTNGNLSSIQGPEKETTCHYDALDRLILVNTGEQKVHYRYDELNRRIEKKTEARGLTTVERYLYQGQNEVGAVNEEGSITQLRLLGVGKGAEIGASVAMELHGRVYVPLSDQQGNVVALIDPETGCVVEAYEYTAFGEQKGNGRGVSPWRFSGKRYDIETGFVYFGRRYYAPWLGKWITPDPAGHDGGPNLYAYVDNAPLTKFDLYGLMPQRSMGMQSQRSYQPQHSMSCHFGRMASTTLRFIGDHMIPIPGIRDLFSALGSFIPRGNLSTYTRSDRQTHSFNRNVYGTNKLNNVSVYHVNGVLNYADEYHADGLTFSASCGFVDMFFTYNATHGFSTDLLETIAQKLGIPTRSVDLCVEGLRKQIEKVGGVGGGGSVIATAHSQGGTILAGALKQLTAEERSMIHVATFGSATMISPKGLGSAVNFISPRDAVPYIGDAFGVAKGAFGKNRYVQFIKPQCKWWSCEHSFQGIYKDSYERYVLSKIEKLEG